MKRIRMEWSNIWAILGEHFNQVGCHENTNVVYFALDKLRQLSVKFLEIEELPNFKFQKEFLRPFEHILANNPAPAIKDMVLACLHQMIQARAPSIKSGWKAMFGVFIRAAKESNDQIVGQAFDVVRNVFRSNFQGVVINQTYPDFVACIGEFCKNKKSVKTRQVFCYCSVIRPDNNHLTYDEYHSLQAIEILKQAIPLVADLSKTLAPGKISVSTDNIFTPQSGAPPTPTSMTNLAPSEDPAYRLWFPTLFGLYEIIMTGDLEVRTRALTYLFDTLKSYGSTFSPDFWEVIAQGVLFPIFNDLKRAEGDGVAKFDSKEEMSIWLSTTLIQALRNFVDLFSYNFDALSFLMDGMLDLLCVCMTQGELSGMIELSSS
jgi:brefeldin A-inhibited guanine nucleotide-exchange protein